MGLTVGQAASSFVPGHADLPHSRGVSAQVGSENLVEALGRVVFYWAYPGVDTFGRTNMWQIMAGKSAGRMLGILPAAPKNHTGGLGDYMSPAQRWVVTPNYDTIYGAGFFDLRDDAVVVQTPTDVPDGHYWTIQIVDVMTNVVHQLGSGPGTPGGKFLLVGSEWEGELPVGFLGLLRMPTEVGAVLPRSFASQGEEGKERARRVLNQLGMYPLAENRDGQYDFAYDEHDEAIYPEGVSAEMIAANPSASRPDWVKPASFWSDLGSMLDAVAHFGPDDAAMAAQARALVQLHKTDERYRTVLDRVVFSTYADLHATANYIQVGGDVGNGWRRQPGGGLWGTDWYGRALASVIYIFVNDYHEALYLTRGLDSDGAVLDGREHYTITFEPDGLPPVDSTRGGFWSITMYDSEIFMVADSPNGRVNIGTALLEAGALRDTDGKLTLHLSATQPDGEDAIANWLPAPAGPFCLALRAYIPEQALLDGDYAVPDVVRVVN